MVQGIHPIDQDLKLITNDTLTTQLTVNLLHEDTPMLSEKGSSCWVCFTDAAKQPNKAKEQIDWRCIFRGAWPAYSRKEQDEAE
nr:unnamed protein product [Digitaria exilis]